MTSTQQSGVSSDRLKNPSMININHLECSICHDVLWKPVACQSCETPFCSGCMNQWLANSANRCPNRCESYTQRKCPPFIVKVLAELEITCFYRCNGCQEVAFYEALDKHEIHCGYQARQCSGCQSEILKKDFDNHTRSCPSIELTCKDCGLVYKRGEAGIKHTENICLKEQMRQMREECKKNMHVTQQLARQVQELRILNAFFTAAKITFDDLPSAAAGEKDIPTTYRGLKWAEIHYAHESFCSKKHSKSGCATAFIPGGGPHIAFFYREASINVERQNETFTFISITACAGWNDNLQLSITGQRNSVQTNKHTTILVFGQPQLILLQWKNVDKITFKPFGGTAHLQDHSGAATVVITQLTIDSLN